MAGVEAVAGEIGLPTPLPPASLIASTTSSSRIYSSRSRRPRSWTDLAGAAPARRAIHERAAGVMRATVKADGRTASGP